MIESLKKIMLNIQIINELNEIIFLTNTDYNAEIITHNLNKSNDYDIINYYNLYINYIYNNIDYIWIIKWYDELNFEYFWYNHSFY